MEVTVEMADLAGAVRLFRAGKMPKGDTCAVRLRAGGTVTFAFGSQVGRMQVDVAGEVIEPGEADLPAVSFFEWVGKRSATSPVTIKVTGESWTARQGRNEWASSVVLGADDPTPLPIPPDATRLVLPREGVAAIRRLEWALLDWQPADPFFFVQASPGWLAATDKIGRYARFAVPESDCALGLPSEVADLAAEFDGDALEFMASNRMLWLTDGRRLATLSTAALSRVDLAGAIERMIAPTAEAGAFTVESGALLAAIDVATIASGDRVVLRWEADDTLSVSGTGTRQAAVVEQVEVTPVVSIPFEGAPFPANDLRNALRHAGKEVEVRLTAGPPPKRLTYAVVRSTDSEDGFEGVVAAFAE